MNNDIKQYILALEKRGYILNKSKTENGKYSNFYYVEKGNDIYKFFENIIIKECRITRVIKGIDVNPEFNDKEKRLINENEALKVGNRVRHVKKVKWGIGRITNIDENFYHVKFSQNKRGAIKIVKECRHLIKKIDINIERKGKFFYKSEGEKLKNILIKLDNNQKLDKYEIDWAKEEKYYDIVARHYELIDNALAKASRYWRYAYNPERAIEITEGEKEPSALTSRGGAFRDILKLQEAIECAELAIDLDEDNSYPYNLLGAIYNQQGKKQKSDENFMKALELGARQEEIDKLKAKTSFFTDYE